MSKHNWKEGTVQDLLDLSDADMALAEDIIAYDRAKKKDDSIRFSFEEVEARFTRKPKTRLVPAGGK